MYRDPEIFDEYHVGIIRLFLHYVEDFPYVYWEDLDVGSELFDFHMFYIAYMEYALPLRPLPYFILADEIPWVERGSETEFTNNMYQANLGDAFAQFKVGYGYYHGEDVGQNYEEAFKWLMQSEKRVAQHEVGKMLLLGLGVNKDVEEAFKWYMKLAQQGDEVAQYRVGEMLFEGQGVDKNVKEAFAFFKISSANGDDRAKIKLELLGNELDVWIGNTNKLNTNDNQENEDEPLEEKVELSSSDIYQYLIDSLSSMPETSASQQSNKIVVLLHQEELHDIKINLEIKGEYLVAETFFPPNPSMMGRLLEVSGSPDFSCKFGKEKNRYVVRRNCEIKKRTADDLYQNILEVISDVKLVNDVLLIEG